MKKYIRKTGPVAAALAVAAALVLTACGGRAPSASAPAENDPPVREEPAAPAAPARTVSYSVQLDGKETTAYLDVSDSEITLWDSAAGGQMLAVAKYAQPLSGAAEALRDCDFTDLDGDGNSELTASFSFADGTTASLLWFYTDGGFVYNEEFSTLPGESPKGNEG